MLATSEAGVVSHRAEGRKRVKYADLLVSHHFASVIYLQLGINIGMFIPICKYMTDCMVNTHKCEYGPELSSSIVTCHLYYVYSSNPYS